MHLQKRNPNYNFFEDEEELNKMKDNLCKEEVLENQVSKSVMKRKGQSKVDLTDLV